MSRSCRHEPKATREYELAGLTFTGLDYSNWLIRGSVCEYGTCAEFDCPVCGCMKGGFGLMDCPCDDTIGYRDMRRKRPVAVKPSVAGRSHISRSRSRKARR